VGPFSTVRAFAVFLLGVALVSCTSEPYPVPDEPVGFVEHRPIERVLTLEVDGEPWVATRVASFELNRLSLGGYTIEIVGRRDDGLDDQVVLSLRLGTDKTRRSVFAGGWLSVVRAGERYTADYDDKAGLNVRVGDVILADGEYFMAFSFSATLRSVDKTKTITVTNGRVRYLNKTQAPDPNNVKN